MNKLSIKKIIFAIIGIAFVGIGVAFNAAAGLGNDSIGIVYDGLRNTLKLSTNQLGLASNIINFGLIILLLLIGRKYINIGTLIYILPYGFFVKMGSKLFNIIFPADMMFHKIVASVLGCMILYFGVSIFIAMDIGLDPFTGLVMVIKDVLKWEYNKTKILFDCSFICIGIILGGKLGVVTVITAFSAGPIIQFMSQKIVILMKLKEGVTK